MNNQQQPHRLPIIARPTLSAIAESLTILPCCARAVYKAAKAEQDRIAMMKAAAVHREKPLAQRISEPVVGELEEAVDEFIASIDKPDDYECQDCASECEKCNGECCEGYDRHDRYGYGGRYNRYDPYDDYGDGCDCPCTCDDAADDCECNGYRNKPAYQDLTDIARIAKEQLKLVPAGNLPAPWEESLTRGVALVDALTSMLRQVAERVKEDDGVTWPSAAGRKTLNGIIRDVQLVACRAIIQSPPNGLEGGDPFDSIATAVAGWDKAVAEIVDNGLANKWFTPPMPQKLAAVAAMLRNPTATAASGDEPLVAIEARFDKLFSEKDITGALHLLTESKHAEAPVFQLRTIKALVGLERYSDVISKPFHTFPTDRPSELIEAAKLCDDRLQSSEQKLPQHKAFEATKCALMLISSAFQHMGVPTQGTDPLVKMSVVVLDRVIKRPENCSGSEGISSGTVDALKVLVLGDNLSKAAVLVLLVPGATTHIGAALPELLAKIADYKTSGALTASKTLARNLFKIHSGSLNDKAQLQIAGADDAVPEDAYEALLAGAKEATGSSGHLPGKSCELLLALSKAFEQKNDLWMTARLTAEAVLCLEFTKTPPIVSAAAPYGGYNHYGGHQKLAQLKLKWTERGRLQASTIRELLSKAVAGGPADAAAGDGGSDVTPAPLLQGTNLKHVLDRLLAATCAGTLWLQALAEFTDFVTRGDQPLLPTATVHKALLAAEKAYKADLAKDESLRTGSLVHPTADHLTVAMLKEVDRCLALKDSSPGVKTLVLAAFRLDLGPVTSAQKQATAHQPPPRTDFNIDRFLPKYEGLVDKAVLFKEMPPEFVRLLPLAKCIAIAAQAEPETALTFIGKANTRLWGTNVWVSRSDGQLGPVVQDLSNLLLKLHASHVSKVDVLFFSIIDMVTPANVSMTRRKQMLGLLIEASASSDKLFDKLASWIPTLRSDALGTIAETNAAKLEFLSTAQTHPRRSAQVHILVQNMFKADPWNEQLQMIAFKGAAGMSNGATGTQAAMDLIDTMFPATGVGLWTIDAPALQASSSQRYGNAAHFGGPSHLEPTAKLSSAHIKKVMEESATRARKVLELIPVVKRYPSCSKKLLACVEGGPVWDDVKRRAIEAWRKVVLPQSFVCSSGHQQDRTMRKCSTCLRVVTKLEQLSVFLLLASDALGETAAGNTVVKSLGAELTRNFKSRRPSMAITDMVGHAGVSFRQAHKVPPVVVPTFRGFPMPVYQVDKRITPVGTTEPATPIKAMPQEGAALIAWLQTVVPTKLKKAVLSFVNDQCATAEVLLSMTLQELVEELSIQPADVTDALVFFAKMRVAGMGPREMITAVQVSAWIMHTVTDSSTIAQQIVDADIDSTVLAACDDEALATAFGDRSVVSVLEQRVLDRLLALRNSLRHQNEDHICPPMRSQADAVNVLVVGGTGAGKSTLFNSLIHELQIVPTNCMRACTATIIELAFLTATVAGEVYVGEVEFITATEWVTELELLVSRAKSSQKDEAQQAALLKLKTVFGSDFDAGSSKSVAELAADPACGDVGKAIRFGAATSADFAKRLRPYVDSADEADKGARWPLVKRVLLRGPWNACFGQLAYVNLLDAPGLHDSNAERAATLAKVLHSADSILLVANSRRAVNDKTTQDAMPLTLRTTLVESGQFGQLALISTQTDLITTSEAIDNLKLPEDSTKLTCALKRNDFTRERAHVGFYEGIDPEILPINRASGDFEPSAVLPAPWEAHVTDATNKGGGEAGRFFFHNPDTKQTSWECPKQDYFQFPVFTVSSVEYQQHKGINVGVGRTDRLFPDAGATGVPALQQYLRDAANALSAGKSRRVGELMAEALNLSTPPDATALAGVAAAPDGASSTVSTSGKRKQSGQGAATSAKRQRLTLTKNVSGSPFSGVTKPALKRQRKDPQNAPAAGDAPAADDEVHEVAAWSNTKVVGEVIDLTFSDSD